MLHPLKIIRPRSLKNLTSHLQHLIQTKLWFKILFAMFLGILIGVFFSPSVGLVGENTSVIIGNWLALPGNVFLGLIQMIVVPLVFASVISGLASSENVSQLKKMGSRLVFYLLITTVTAISIGLLVALLIQPGNFINSDLANQALQMTSESEQATVTTPLDFSQVPKMISDILPENPLGSMVNKEMLKVVLFAIVLGLALVSMSSQDANPLLNLLTSIQEVCMTVVRWAMLLAPIAVFGLLAQITMKVGLDALLGVAVYVVTVLLGLLVLLMFYLLIVTFISRKSPLQFLRHIREVQLLAFSTSSSAAVMPLSIEVAEEKLGVRSSISQFLIPLGATINMDGTALYQGVATVFLAQVFNIPLSFPSLVLIVVTAVGASIGSAATPGVGIVILSMVLKSVGIPASGIALIIGVDRILDMSRTAINVTGDLTATTVLDRWLGDSLEKVTETTTETES